MGRDFCPLLLEKGLRKMRLTGNIDFRLSSLHDLLAKAS